MKSTRRLSQQIDSVMNKTLAAKADLILKENAMNTERQAILLESGTNEFEIVEFTLGSVPYGINVAKVREVINDLPVTSIAGSHPDIAGLFTLRDKVIPLIDLAKNLNITSSQDKSTIIVSELNNFLVGFKVDSVSRIHRISWSQLEPPPPAAGSDRVIGIIKIDNRLVLLLDFEKITAEINPGLQRKLEEVPPVTADLITSRSQKTILIAEDSPLLREMLNNTLHTAGYTNLIILPNGSAAWEKLAELIANKQLPDLIITDIEMPQMDGHHLTKKIKNDSILKDLPVIIFSSLINPEMRLKGELLGADAQITKPEIVQLISWIDRLIHIEQAS
jgi:two-component system chemotaxis response regulator CheV